MLLHLPELCSLLQLNNTPLYVGFLNWKDPLEKGMATHSSILAWRIPWTKLPGKLQYMESQRVGHDWVTNTTFIWIYCILFLCQLMDLWVIFTHNLIFFFVHTTQHVGSFPTRYWTHVPCSGSTESLTTEPEKSHSHNFILTRFLHASP